MHHSNDVYSIGATIYDILTGTAPFRATDAAILTQQINHEAPVTMSRTAQATGARTGPPVYRGDADSARVGGRRRSLPRERSRQTPAHRARAIAVRLGLVDDEGEEKSRNPVPFPPSAAAVTLATGAGIWFYVNRVSTGAKGEAAPVAHDATPGAGNAATIAPDGSATLPGKRDESRRKDDAKTNAVPVVTSRTGWDIVAVGAVHVIVSRESDGAVEFDGQLGPGEKHTLPVDKTLLVELKDGKGFGVEVDGHRLTPPSAAYARWLVTVPTSSDQPATVKEGPPPFEAELGPLVKSGQITQLETRPGCARHWAATRATRSARSPSSCSSPTSPARWENGARARRSSSSPMAPRSPRRIRCSGRGQST